MTTLGVVVYFIIHRKFNTRNTHKNIWVSESKVPSLLKISGNSTSLLTSTLKAALSDTFAVGWNIETFDTTPGDVRYYFLQADGSPIDNFTELYNFGCRQLSVEKSDFTQFFAKTREKTITGNR